MAQSASSSAFTSKKAKPHSKLRRSWTSDRRSSDPTRRVHSAETQRARIDAQRVVVVANNDQRRCALNGVARRCRRQQRSTERAPPRARPRRPAPHEESKLCAHTLFFSPHLSLSELTLDRFAISA